MRALARALRHQSAIQRVMRQLHQSVGKSPMAFSIVALAGARRQRLEGRAQDRAAFGIENAANPQQAALPRAQSQ
jgi:hypothetical protein